MSDTNTSKYKSNITIDDLDNKQFREILDILTYEDKLVIYKDIAEKIIGQETLATNKDQVLIFYCRVNNRFECYDKKVKQLEMIKDAINDLFKHYYNIDQPFVVIGVGEQDEKDIFVETMPMDKFEALVDSLDSMKEIVATSKYTK